MGTDRDHLEAYLPLRPARVHILPSLAGLCLLALPALLLGQGSPDWPQFRGPGRDGIATVFSAPRVWPAQLTRKWKVDVGEGYATPILVRDRLYAFTRQGEHEVMQAIDAATGKSLWRTTYAATVTLRPGNRPHGPGPKSTPVFHDGRLFTFGMSGILTAFDAATGKQLWQRPGDAVLPLWNPASSPAVEQGLLIVHVGGDKQGALTAFDAATGSVKWEWPGDGPSYSSPVIADLHGVRQIVTLTQANIVGVAVADGRLLWRRPFPASNQNIVMPVVLGDTIVAAGYQKPTSAFRVVRKGDEWAIEDLWENPDVWQFMTNPVMVGDRLFGLSTRNRGEYFLLDTKSGARVWSSMPRQGENAAIVRAGAVLISLEDDGELMVGRVTGAEFQELKRYTVSDEGTWAAPVVSGNRIFVKDVSSLSLWTVN
jgi:outer membrane protein assembly factor BamB